MVSGDALANELAESLSAYLNEKVWAGVSGDGWMILDLGMSYSDGASAVIHVRGRHSGVELSDGGETFARLVLACEIATNAWGEVETRATALCGAYGVTFGADVDEIRWTGPRSEWVDAAKRICTASLAIDSWRWWMEEA